MSEKPSQSTTEEAIALSEPERERLEKEVLLDSGVTERKKIVISPDMDEKVIQEKFHVSKTTAWRAKQRGWLFQHYQERAVLPDSVWAEAHARELKESAEAGSRIAMRKLNKILPEICPFEFSDLVSSAYVRLMELSGHPHREIPYWRNTVARNAVLDFIKTQVIAAGKVFSDEEYDESKDRLMRN